MSAEARCRRYSIFLGGFHGGISLISMLRDPPAESFDPFFAISPSLGHGFTRHPRRGAS